MITLVSSLLGLGPTLMHRTVNIPYPYEVNWQFVPYQNVPYHKFDYIRISKAYMWLCSGMEWSLMEKLVSVKALLVLQKVHKSFKK